jgi:hypothetical protein
VTTLGQGDGDGEEKGEDCETHDCFGSASGGVLVFERFLVVGITIS